MSFFGGGQIAIALADRAVHITRTRFGYDLDYSHTSLVDLDQLLVRFPTQSRTLWRRWPPKMHHELRQCSILWGCYLGEVLHRHLGGEWRLTTESPLQLDSFQLLFFRSTYPPWQLLPAQEVYYRIVRQRHMALQSLYLLVQAQTTTGA